MIFLFSYNVCVGAPCLLWRVLRRTSEPWRTWWTCRCLLGLRAHMWTVSSQCFGNNSIQMHQSREVNQWGKFPEERYEIQKVSKSGKEFSSLSSASCRYFVIPYFKFIISWIIRLVTCIEEFKWGRRRRLPCFPVWS